MLIGECKRARSSTILARIENVLFVFTRTLLVIQRILIYANEVIFVYKESSHSFRRIRVCFGSKFNTFFARELIHANVIDVVTIESVEFLSTNE